MRVDFPEPPREPPDPELPPDDPLFDVLPDEPDFDDDFDDDLEEDVPDPERAEVEPEDPPFEPVDLAVLDFDAVDFDALLRDRDPFALASASPSEERFPRDLPPPELPELPDAFLPRELVLELDRPPDSASPVESALSSACSLPDEPESPDPESRASFAADTLACSADMRSVTSLSAFAAGAGVVSFPSTLDSIRSSNASR